MLGVQMSLTNYFEEYFLPNEKSSETKKIEIRSNVGPLTNLFKFFDEWIRYSYEAWVKAGKPEIL